MNKTNKVILASAMIWVAAAIPTRACVTPPAGNLTVLRLVIINPGPPMQVRLVFDPWTTTAAGPGDFCASAFRLPPSIVASINAVRLAETGTNTTITQFSWAADNDTTGAVEALMASGPDDDWFGFSSGISAALSAGTSVDFQVDVTLQAGMTHNDLVKHYGTMGATLQKRAFSDKANPNGTPMNVHQAFIDLLRVNVPTMSEWGMAAMALAVLCGAPIVIRRKRVATPA